MKRVWVALLAVLLTACTPLLHIDRLGIHKQIVPGGQATVDAGNVTYMLGNLLAGHRTTHGAVFRNLPAMYVGETFFTTGFMGRSLIKWVVVKKVVTTSNSAGQLAGYPLVLQTSMPGGARLLVYCQRA